MNNINGISMSYISSDDDMGPVAVEGTSTSHPLPSALADRGSTFLKIWDGKQDRSMGQFLSGLPADIRENIKDYSTRYTFHGAKPDFQCSSLIGNRNKQGNSNQDNSRRGGFRNPRSRGGRR